MVEQNKLVNVHAMKQEIEDGKMIRNTQEQKERGKSLPTINFEQEV